MTMRGEGSLPRAVLFDLDGTLVDSLPDIAGALADLLRARGLEPHPPEAVARMIGKGVANLVQTALSARGQDATEADVAAYLALYEPRATRDTGLYPGMAAAVAALHAAGVALAVVTNKPTAVSIAILQGLGLGEAFAVVVGGDAGPPRKPAPDLLLLALSRLGVAAQAAVMVGDSAADVGAARAAGMPVVVVDWGYTPQPAGDLGADHVVSSAENLVAVLRQVGRTAP